MSNVARCARQQQSTQQPAVHCSTPLTTRPHLHSYGPALWVCSDGNGVGQPGAVPGDRLAFEVHGGIRHRLPPAQVLFVLQGGAAADQMCGGVSMCRWCFKAQLGRRPGPRLPPILRRFFSPTPALACGEPPGRPP